MPQKRGLRSHALGAAAQRSAARGGHRVWVFKRGGKNTAIAAFMVVARARYSRHHYRNMSVVPTVRRPSPTAGVGTAIGKYSRRSIGTADIFLSCITRILATVWHPLRPWQASSPRQYHAIGTRPRRRQCGDRRRACGDRTMQSGDRSALCTRFCSDPVR